MFIKLALLAVLVLITLGEFYYASACLITNCPIGGKRSKFGSSGSERAASIKRCISCGPGLSGQCFGPGICCGPFGCLLGTAETLICLREGQFHEREPCIAGSGQCRKNTGRCAFEGICCNQESCHADRSCTSGTNNVDKVRLAQPESLDLYSLINNYPVEMTVEK